MMATCVMAMTAVSGMANDYTDNLEVSIDGSATSQQATISLDKQENGSSTLTLKNFILSMGGNQIGVGTIQIDSVSVIASGDKNVLVANKVIKIKEGEGTSPSGIWLASNLPPIPIQLMGEQRDDKLYAVINIDMKASINSDIKVTFGDGNYQIGNSSFEDFHKEVFSYEDRSGDVTEYVANEPNHWHSFGSSHGYFANIVKTTIHTFASDVTRPGSTGRQSVLVTSGKVLGIAVANGTITTGRMTAGAMVATDPKNHAELDLDSTAVDSNGDPFYTKLSGVPDSLAVWVKFKQGGEVAKYPYATVSAAITDGTYYQEPNDKEYTNIVARGGNKEIASNGFVWQRICFPFTAVNAALDPKAILVTISTNAAPGKGTGTDSLYVDDLSLIYNQDITVKGISVQGQALELADSMKYETLSASVLTLDDFVVDTDAKRVIKTLDVTNGSSVVSIFVASEDLKTFKTYTVSTPSRVATGIDAVGTSTTANSSAADGIYTLSGQRASTMKPGQVYIVKKGGKTYKAVKR